MAFFSLPVIPVKRPQRNSKCCKIVRLVILKDPLLPHTQIPMPLGKIVEAMSQILPLKFSSPDIPLAFCQWWPSRKNNLARHMGTFWMSWCSWLWRRRLHIVGLCYWLCQRKVASPLFQKLPSPASKMKHIDQMDLNCSAWEISQINKITKLTKFARVRQSFQHWQHWMMPAKVQCMQHI